MYMSNEFTVFDLFFIVGTVGHRLNILPSARAYKGIDLTQVTSTFFVDIVSQNRIGTGIHISVACISIIIK